MVYNEKMGVYRGTAPNENFARELLQLFSIGTERLNLDGSPQLDAGEPIPTFDPDIISALARALTGWTYPTEPGAVPQLRNPPYFVGQMQPVESLHDTGAKTLLDGFVIDAGQTAEQDLDAVISHVSSHQNVAPFIGRRLIQHLVTSNPSPEYVARVAAAFESRGRGDLKTVIKAIVLDREARAGDASGVVATTAGHLREPILYVLGMMRTLGVTINSTALLAGVTGWAGQLIFYPPSVFNYFSPLYEIPGMGVRGPEFQIFTPSTAVIRTNLAHIVVFAPEAIGLSLNLAPFEEVASVPSQLVEAANQTLLLGRMTPEARSIIESAVAVVPSGMTRVRAQTALYLVASSNEYQVQH